MLAVYERLLVLYPSSFRARFGEEMTQLVRDEATHGRRVPWVRTFADLFGSAITQRWKDKNMRAKWLLVPFGVGLALFVPLMVVGSTFSVEALLVVLAEAALAALIGGAAMLLGRRTRGAEFDYTQRRFRWWWVPAGLIGGAEIVMITLQLIKDPKATNVFAAAIFCGFGALVFGGMSIRNRRTGNWMIALGVVPGSMLYWSIFPPIVALIVIIMALSENVRLAARTKVA
jgi:hypothetical protein